MSPRGGTMDDWECKHCGTMIDVEAKFCSHCGARQGWTAPMKVLFFILILVSIGWIVKLGENSSTPTPTPEPTLVIPQRLTPREEALSLTKLQYTWEKTGFGSVMEANFIIDNRSDYTIKDITIKCVHFAKSGTIVDSSTASIYDIVKAKSKKKVNQFNMGFIHRQAASTNCEIIDVKVD